MGSETFSVGEMVHGYHLYRDIWDTALGNHCLCWSSSTTYLTCWQTLWRSKELLLKADPWIWKLCVVQLMLESHGDFHSGIPYTPQRGMANQKL